MRRTGGLPRAGAGVPFDSSMQETLRVVLKDVLEKQVERKVQTEMGNDSSAFGDVADRVEADMRGELSGGKKKKKKKPPPPPAFRITAPYDNYVRSSGLYTLVPGRTAHSYPVYKMDKGGKKPNPTHGGDRWLFVGDTLKWFIWDWTADEKDFEVHQGWVISRDPAQGLFPHEITDWDIYDVMDKEYQKSTKVSVRVAQPELPPPKRRRKAGAKAVKADADDELLEPLTQGAASHVDEL